MKTEQEFTRFVDPLNTIDQTDFAEVHKWRVMHVPVKQLNRRASGSSPHNALVRGVLLFALPEQVLAIDEIVVLRLRILFFLGHEQHDHVRISRREHSARERMVRLIAPQFRQERPVVGSTNLEGVKSNRHDGSGSLYPNALGDRVHVIFLV
jgi:hypothetical protein